MTLGEKENKDFRTHVKVNFKFYFFKLYSCIYLFMCYLTWKIQLNRNTLPLSDDLKKNILLILHFEKFW